MLADGGDLSFEEHPSVWRFEVEHSEDEFVCRGLRKTLAEAKQHAEHKALDFLLDAVSLAEGF